MGRKTKYRKEYADLVRAEKVVGNEDKEIAARLGVRRQTLYEWASAKGKDGKPKYPDFADALATKKEFIVGNARLSLVKQALGYEVTETKTVILRTKKGDTVQRIEKTTKHIAPIPISTFKLLDQIDHANFPRNSEGGESSKGALAELMELLKSDVKLDAEIKNQ